MKKRRKDYSNGKSRSFYQATLTSDALRPSAGTAQRPTGTTRHRKENRIAFFSAIPNGKVAADACTRRINNAVARPLETNHYRFLRRRAAERRSVAAGMV